MNIYNQRGYITLSVCKKGKCLSLLFGFISQQGADNIRRLISDFLEMEHLLVTTDGSCDDNDN